MTHQTHSRIAVPVVHDVLGTLFPPQHAAVPLKEHMLPNVNQDLILAVVDDWFHSSQRDFTFPLPIAAASFCTSDTHHSSIGGAPHLPRTILIDLSMNGKYVQVSPTDDRHPSRQPELTNNVRRPIGQILKASLPRVLVEKGLLSPDKASTFDISPVTSILSSVPPRPSFMGLHTALSTCKSVEFKLVAATNGAAQTTRQLFNNALEPQESEKWEIFSCDEIQTAKPAPAVYEAVWHKLGMHDKASRRACFMTAWTAYEEHLPLPELWGETDIVAKDLEDAARQIIAKEEERAKNEFM
ncbi:hypothetical protein OIV83_003114 [Microbotryomycetes sp. JL201]|nr:hypothetical protein OIV83_003114 [Microbotryomycetes sp. JL201]